MLDILLSYAIMSIEKGTADRQFAPQYDYKK